MASYLFLCTDVHRAQPLSIPRMKKEFAALAVPLGREMATAATKQVQEAKVVATTVTPATVNPTAVSSPRAYGAAAIEKKLVGYGMPCSHCHAYYPGDMTACPICKCPDRISPTEPVIHSTVASSAPAAADKVEAERERLLKELNSQAFASHMPISPATFQCVLSHQHSGSTEPAAVCHNCYSTARQEADRFEAALHIDSKEAAKIVYDAVWADTSDPNASYYNAANALLTEIRRRAGIGLLLGSHQPLAH